MVDGDLYPFVCVVLFADPLQIAIISVTSFQPEAQYILFVTCSVEKVTHSAVHLLTCLIMTVLCIVFHISYILV